MKKCKILSVSWFWYPTGGDWTYIENINKLYVLNGYEVIPFSAKNEKNITVDSNKYFVDSFDFKEVNKKRNVSNGIKVIKSAIVSSDAVRKLKLLLEEHDIKIAHLHNIHHYITPAIIDVLKQRNIKIIWSLHDYKIICPENSFVSNGKICEKCINGAYINCTLNKCKKSSFLASMLASIDAYYYHKSKVYDKVDHFLCPSLFLYNKFLQAGFKKEKLSVTNYCYDISIIDSLVQSRIKETCILGERYILYVGRLENIKGVKTLISAVSQTNITLKIIGGGTIEKELKEMVIKNSYTNIEFLGFQSKNEVFNYTYNAEFVICPSEWYENFPFSIIETFLFSKPVIGSRIGGIPELVIDNLTGFLFETGNVVELKERISYLWENPSIAIRLGENARKHAYELVNNNTHWEKIKHILNN